MSTNKRAVLSGALGATASLVGKLALASDSPAVFAVQSHSFCASHSVRPNDGMAWVCPLASLATRGLCLLCMIGINALMIGSFLDGMNESGSVVGTSLSTAANFSCSVRVSSRCMYFLLYATHRSNTWLKASSTQNLFRKHIQAIFGMLFLGELVPLSWYGGAALISAGMWLLSSVTLVDSASTNSSSKDC